jgi:vacuolar-type H+-ATPase subunit I/STV1
MNENNVLREHVKENEQEIENLREKVNGKQETYEEIVENLDSKLTLHSVTRDIMHSLILLEYFPFSNVTI